VTDRRQRRVLLVGASLLSVSMSAFELVPASVTPLIRESMGVSAAEAGLVVGTMFGTAVVASLPVGAVLDRTDSRLAVAAAIGLLLVSGAWGYLAGTAGDYPALLASRVVGGLAYVVVWNAGIDIVGRAFPPATRATAVSTFTASGPVGFALGQALGPVVAGVFGWPAVFPVFAVSTLLGLTLFWPASRGTGRVEDQPAPTPADLRRVVTDRRVVLVGVLGFLAYSLYLFVNSWAPSYLTEELKLSLALGGALTALFPAVGVLSRVSGGLLSDRLFDGRRTPVVFGSFLVATPVVAGFTSLRGVPVIVAALLVAGFAIQLSLGLVFAYVRELVDPAVAATAVAFLTSVGLAGAFLAPIAAGAIIERSGYETAFLVAGGLGLVGVVLARVASEPT
jgi:nitrate/nitrite transporter NarK